MTTIAMIRISPRPFSESWNACAVPWNVVEIADGSVAARRCLISSTASPSASPGLRLNEIVTDGSWPVWLTVSGPASVVIVASVFNGMSAAGRGPDVQHRHRGRILLEFRRDLQNHLILIVRRVDLRHLTRAVGVVQRRLHLIHGQAERRNLVAIHRDLDLRVLHLQVAAHVLEAWYFAHLGFEDRRPVIELRGVGILQRELIEAARAHLAAEVDRWLIDQKTRMPGTCDSFGRRSAMIWSTLRVRSARGLRSIERRPVFSPPPPGPPPRLSL